MTLLAMDAATGALWLGIATLAFGFMTAVFQGFMVYVMGRMAQDQKEVKKELAVIHTTTNGMSEKLALANVNQGHAQGTLDERDRARQEQAAVDLGVAEEKLRDKSGSTIATVNGTIGKNVQVVKEDVAKVKDDVQDVHDKVVKKLDR